MTLPILVLSWRWGFLFGEIGLTEKNLGLSVKLGLIATIFTLFVHCLVAPPTNPILSIYSFFLNQIPLFLSAFNEELLFRGVLFFLIAKKSKNTILAYILSTATFIFWHPLEIARIIPVLIQATLMCYVIYETGNISGCFLAHGLNRVLLPVVGQWI
ncbi:MAG: CPBP family intramembrane glutamic endopeptidase [Candidatus Altiarchaeota archaeon]